MPDGENQWLKKAWESRRDRLWRQAISSPLGREFWARVRLVPTMNPNLLTEAQVARLAKELAWVGRTNPEVFIPYYRQRWIEMWRVPKPERWADVPIQYESAPAALIGWRGRYRPREGITLTREGIAPAIIAHEMAHKNWFELSPTMQWEVGKILDWLEKNSPSFRRYTMHRGTPYWRKIPAERHAMLYQMLGRHRETIPYYLDKYYLGLKPWKIGEGLGTRRWLLREGQITPKEFYTHPWED